MGNRFTNFVKVLFASLQMAFICPSTLHPKCNHSNIHVARGQNAPRREDISFLTEQGKICGNVKDLVDAATMQAKKIGQNPSAANVQALRKTYEKLLKYQQKGYVTSKLFINRA
jgi:hemolysin activation/secretion protein